MAVVDLFIGLYALIGIHAALAFSCSSLALDRTAPALEGDGDAIRALGWDIS